MPLELKDLATQKVVVVPEEGLTFGREGGDANIQIRDTGVSKRHARVFGENGAWFLEDLGSSNGTWLQKERIKDATELLPGDVFQLSQAKYEVLQATTDGEGAEPTSMARDEDGADEEPAPEEDEATPKPLPASAKPNKPAPVPAKEASGAKPKPATAPPPSKKLPVQKGAEANKKTEAGVSDAAPTDAAPKKKGGVAGLIGGVGLIILPTALGLTANVITRLVGGGSSSSAQAAVADAQARAAEAQAEAAEKAAEAQAAAAERQAEGAVAAAEKQAGAPVKPQGAAPAPAPAAEKPGAAAPAPPPAEEKKPAPPPSPAAAARPPDKPAEPAAAAGAAGGGYGAWHAKWEAVEKRITDDPTILNKDASVLGLYKRLEEDIYEVEQKYSKGRKASEKRVNDHLRDAELYEKTEKTVLELHGKLFR